MHVSNVGKLLAVTVTQITLLLKRALTRFYPVRTTMTVGETEV